MPAQAKSRRKRKDADPNLADLHPYAERAIKIFAEQVAVPLDQLARFLDCGPVGVNLLLEDLAAAGLVDVRGLLGGQPPWAWPTRRGLRLSGTGSCFQVPSLRWLPHRRAVNEVRLHLEERAPRGRWICERKLRRRLEPNTHIPDAVFEVDGERHAIEVELSCKSKAEWRLIIGSHSDRYDAVIYFCGPQARGPLNRVRDQQGWPKLVVRDTPGLDSLVDYHYRTSAVPLCDRRTRGWEPGRDQPRERRNPEAWERRVLRLISEQGALPLDQLALFLNCHPTDADRLARHLVDGSLAKQGDLLTEGPEWIWLTSRGASFAETDLRAYDPAPGSLRETRTINAVRLQVEARDALARWICARTLRRQSLGPGRSPKAVVESGGERHAIEVEVQRVPSDDFASMIDRRSANYDGVVVFCSPRRARHFESLRADNHWPKLLIQHLPSASSSPALSPSPWARQIAGRPVKFPYRRRKSYWRPAKGPECSELSSQLWEELTSLLMEDRRFPAGHSIHRLCDRNVLSGIVYVARSGTGWVRHPQELSPGRAFTCLNRLRLLEELGAWSQIQRLLEARLPDGEQIAWSTLTPEAAARAGA